MENISDLYEILRNVGEVMNVSIYYPEFAYSETPNGGTIIRRFERSDDDKIAIFRPIFKVPRVYRNNEPAVTGYFAHELGHVKLLFDRRHRAYLWMRKQMEDAGNPLFYVPALIMYLIEENRVDKLACNFGFAEEISEARKFSKNSIELKFSDS